MESRKRWRQSLSASKFIQPVPATSFRTTNHRAHADQYEPVPFADSFFVIISVVINGTRVAALDPGSRSGSVVAVPYSRRAISAHAQQVEIR